MYALRKPSLQAIEAFRISQTTRPTFTAVGEIANPPPPGYRANSRLQLVGYGQRAFIAAANVVRHWRMFPAWVRVETGGEPVRIGLVAAVIARCCGFWGVNCCRIVDVTETDREFAFTYATTDEHALSGAERFWVEWRADDSVWFGVHSVSRPRDLAVWLVLPWLRRMQARFGVEATAAVQRAIENRHAPAEAATP